jgi:hypothetical protein
MDTSTLTNAPLTPLHEGGYPSDASRTDAPSEGGKRADGRQKGVKCRPLRVTGG